MRRILALMFIGVLIFALSLNAADGTGIQKKNDRGIGIGISKGIQQTSSINDWRQDPHFSIRKYWNTVGIDFGLGHKFDGETHKWGAGLSLLVRLKNTENVNVNLPISIGMSTYEIGWDTSTGYYGMDLDNGSLVANMGKYVEPFNERFTDWGFSIGIEYEWFPQVSLNNNGRFALRYNLNYNVYRDDVMEETKSGFNGGIGFAYYFGNPKYGYRYNEPYRPYKRRQTQRTYKPVAPPMPQPEASYYVMINGQKYGPANVATLQQWKNENRIPGNAILIDADTGNTLNLNQIIR